MTSMKKIAFITFIAVLVFGNIYLGWNYAQARKEIERLNMVTDVFHKNIKVIEFANLFIEKVLKADSEVDFETRLKLENDVRELNDPDILASWQTFTQSKTETEAQKAVKNLLGVLIAKMDIKTEAP